MKYHNVCISLISGVVGYFTHALLYPVADINLSSQSQSHYEKVLASFDDQLIDSSTPTENDTATEQGVSLNDVDNEALLSELKLSADQPQAVNSTGAEHQLVNAFKVHHLNNVDHQELIAELMATDGVNLLAVYQQMEGEKEKEDFLYIATYAGDTELANHFIQSSDAEERKIGYRMLRWSPNSEIDENAVEELLLSSYEEIDDFVLGDLTAALSSEEAVKYAGQAVTQRLEELLITSDQAYVRTHAVTGLANAIFNDKSTNVSHSAGLDMLIGAVDDDDHDVQVAALASIELQRVPDTVRDQFVNKITAVSNDVNRPLRVRINALQALTTLDAYES